MRSTKRVIVELGMLLIGAVAVLWGMRFLSSPKASENKPDRASWGVREHRQLDTEPESSMEYRGYQKAKASPGFTTYPESGSARVDLVNMSGKIVHHWDLDAARARLLPNCNLLVLHGTKWGLEVEPWRSLRNVIREYDWEGDLVWEYRQTESLHHDINVLPNGNLVTIRRISIPKAFTAGAPLSFFRGIRVRSDEIFEVTREGEEVWTWKFHEHKKLSSCGRFACESPGARVLEGEKEFDWTHVNTVSVVPQNKWYDQGDERFRPGNLFIMPRNWSVAMLIDRKSGNIVWEYEGDYKGGLSFGHEPHMIEPGLPGAGNVLIFDNGEERGASYALEINPVSGKVEWVFDAGKAFFSRIAGSLQRLPNGNTLISQDIDGKVFEVTPQKEIVWQYEGNKIRSARARRFPPHYCSRLQELPLH